MGEGFHTDLSKVDREGLAFGRARGHQDGSHGSSHRQLHLPCSSAAFAALAMGRAGPGHPESRRLVHPRHPLVGGGRVPVLGVLWHGGSPIWAWRHSTAVETASVGARSRGWAGCFTESGRHRRSVGPGRRIRSHTKTGRKASFNLQSRRSLDRAGRGGSSRVPLYLSGHCFGLWLGLLRAVHPDVRLGIRRRGREVHSGTNDSPGSRWPASRSKPKATRAHAIRRQTG